MKLAFQRIAFAAVLAAFGSATMAQEATPDTWLNIDTAKSRAQVSAELVQARRDGSIEAAAEGYLPRVASVTSRQDVLAAINAEASVVLRAATRPAVRTIALAA